MSDTEMKEALESFKEPAFPYVAFLATKYRSKKAVTTVIKKPFILDIRAQHADPMKIDYYLAKGWPILKYRMPTRDEKETLTNAKIGATNFGDDKDIYLELEQKLNMATGSTDNRVKEVTSERDELQRRVNELEARTRVQAKSDVIADAVEAVVKEPAEKGGKDVKRKSAKA
jgi:hypothetical protein